MTSFAHRTLAQHHLPYRNHRAPGPTELVRKVALSLLVAVAFAAAVSWASQSSALTAPDTQWSSTGGAATATAATASGYGVRWVGYITDPTDPGAVAAVTFTLEPPTARTARVQFAAGGAWYPCRVTAGAARCDTTAPRLAFADVATLTVSAVG